MKLNALMTELNYSVIACAIRKNDLSSKHRAVALDPYLLSLDILVERFRVDVGQAGGNGLVVAEKRGPELDKELDSAWHHLHLRVAGGEDHIKALDLRAKKDNIAGLQLADLVVSPIGRHLLGKPDNDDWRIVKRKLKRARDGKVEGFGLVVLPK